jgi:nitroreductase
MKLEDFSALVRTRRTCRHFVSTPLPAGMLDGLLDCARWAPSGYNLQPVHFVTVSDDALKPSLYAAGLKQKQILEAPVTVVFAGDRRPVDRNFEEVLKLDRDAGAMTPEYEALLRKFVPLAFGRGPVGLGRLAKFFGAPILRWFTPTPSIPAVEARFWATKQVMLAAMNFMLAAHAAGLATVPMEGFDEGRVKKLLKIPRDFIVPLIIPVGYATPGEAKKSRLPLARLRHDNRW